MKPATAYSVLVAMGAFLFLLLTVAAAPVEPDDEPSENAIGHQDNDLEYSGWDAVNTAALRKLLLQLDTEDRLGRVTRSWPQTEQRGWGARDLSGRLARPWRADKRQVRFRQCYFNPISCFRK